MIRFIIQVAVSESGLVGFLKIDSLLKRLIQV